MKAEYPGCEHHFKLLKRLGSPGPLSASPCTTNINSRRVLAAGNGCSVAIEDPKSENRHL